MLLSPLRRINLLLITLLALTFVAYLLDYRLIGNQLSFWSGYPDFLRRIFAGDLGLSSVSGLPVLDEIRHYFPATLILCLAAFASLPLAFGESFLSPFRLRLFSQRASCTCRGRRLLSLVS